MYCISFAFYQMNVVLICISIDCDITYNGMFVIKIFAICHELVYSISAWAYAILFLLSKTNFTQKMFFFGIYIFTAKALHTRALPVITNICFDIGTVWVCSISCSLQRHLVRTFDIFWFSRTKNGHIGCLHSNCRCVLLFLYCKRHKSFRLQTIAIFFLAKATSSRIKTEHVN